MPTLTSTHAGLALSAATLVVFGGLVASISHGVAGVASGIDDVRPAGPRAVHPEVVASVETDPVPSFDDAADDPAIWVHPTDPAKSLILGTDKKHGLMVYTLAGKQVQAIPAGRLNNVDVRQGIVGWTAGSLAVATNRTTKTIDFFSIDDTGKVAPVGSIASNFDDPYGISLYRSPTSKQLFVFACDKGGLTRQWRIELSAGTPTGQVAAQEVRSFHIGTQAEGMVADDDRGLVYIGEEKAGVWKYNAEPDASANRTLVAAASPVGPLVADVEGLAIARGPAVGSGFLVVSSQGDDSYHLFDLSEPHAHRGAFRIGKGAKPGTPGSVEDTDGIEVLTRSFGPAFPEGLIVAQDGRNGTKPQNFKLVGWGDVLRTLKLDAAGVPATPTAPGASTAPSTETGSSGTGGVR